MEGVVQINASNSFFLSPSQKYGNKEQWHFADFTVNLEIPFDQYSEQMRPLSQFIPIVFS